MNAPGPDVSRKLARCQRAGIRLRRSACGLPSYRLAGELGPDHRKSFVVEVLVEGSAIASAEGRSKKEAAQAAARAALERLSA